ncbi:MAG: thiazole biosynthesis protein, partial [Pseudomonadales bacterium]
KQEIVDQTKALGCFDLVASIPEYCGVISDRPTTRAKLDKVEAEERNLDMDIIDTAIEEMRIVRIDNIVENLAAKADIEAISKVSDSQKIVDIRAPAEQEKKPLNMPGCEILLVPFYELESQLANWDAESEYLLYCEKGVMSQLHAQSIQEKGWLNVKVYRPEI